MSTTAASATAVASSVSVKDLFDWLSYVINICIAGAFAWKNIKSRLLHRTLMKFFGGVIVPIYFPVRIAARPGGEVALEDFHAASNLAQYLTKNGLGSDFRQLRSDGALDPDIASVVICGPKSHSIVVELMRQDPYYSIEIQPDGVWCVVDKRSGARMKSPIDQQESRNADLGYLGRHGSRSKKFILISGIHAIGSLGVVHFITDGIRNIARLARIAQQDCFSLVVLCKFNRERFLIEDSEVALPIKTFRLDVHGELQ